jgi:hypothetical protein
VLALHGRSKRRLGVAEAPSIRREEALHFSPSHSKLHLRYIHNVLPRASKTLNRDTIVWYLQCRPFQALYGPPPTHCQSCTKSRIEKKREGEPRQSANPASPLFSSQLIGSNFSAPRTPFPPKTYFPSFPRPRRPHLTIASQDRETTLQNIEFFGHQWPYLPRRRSTSAGYLHSRTAYVALVAACIRICFPLRRILQ